MDALNGQELHEHCKALKERLKSIDEVSALNRSLGETREEMEKIRRGHQELKKHCDSDLELLKCWPRKLRKRQPPPRPVSRISSLKY